MNYRSSALVLLWVPALAFACGGKTGGGGSDGGPGSGSSSGGTSGSSSGSVSGSSSGGEPVDASPAIDATAPVFCNGVGGGGSSGGATDGEPPPCEISQMESCSDGTEYSVNCQCPQGTCTCTAMGTGAGSGGSVSYPACPSCTQATNLFALCGFPQ